MEFRVKLQPHRNKFRVLRSIKVQLHHDKHPALNVNIKRLFVTDLDSVPHIPGIYQLLKGKTVAAALLHDWMYTKQINRKRADDYFLMLMRYEGVKRRYRYPIYWLVRLLGQERYKKKSGITA